MESYIDELKNKTIYDALQETDTLNDLLLNKVKTFNTEVSKFVELPGYENISIEQIPHLDIPEIQRNLIDAHKNNHYLDQVLKGKDSFVNSVTEVYNRKHKGWRRWFPIRKDEEYNREIKELDEILKTDLKITSDSEFTKHISIGAFYTVGSFAIFAPLIWSLGNYNTMEPYVPLMVSVFMGVAGFGLATAAKILNPKALQIKAEYLDKKIEDLMR